MHKMDNGTSGNVRYLHMNPENTASQSIGCNLDPARQFGLMRFCVWVLTEIHHGSPGLRTPACPQTKANRPADTSHGTGLGLHKLQFDPLRPHDSHDVTYHSKRGTPMSEQNLSFLARDVFGQAIPPTALGRPGLGLAPPLPSTTLPPPPNNSKLLKPNETRPDRRAWNLQSLGPSAPHECDRVSGAAQEACNRQPQCV